MRIRSWILGVALASPATGQTTLHVFAGDAGGEQFGSSIGSADVDGDGRPDLIVGAWLASDGGPASGAVKVLSGRDGSLLHDLAGPSGSHFGLSVAGVGDLNGDGREDFAVGAEWDSTLVPKAGSVSVHSGADAALLFTLRGTDADEEMGRSVAGIGDVNADGVPDLVVGSPHEDDFGSDSGAVRVFSGADGALIHASFGSSPNDHLGFSVVALGDTDLDGWPDYAAGAWGVDVAANNAGRVRVFSGFSGAVLFDLDGAAADDRYGISVGAAGDVDADGVPDLIVGAPQADLGGVDSGGVWVHSGVDGSVLHVFPGDGAGDNLGFGVSGAGDVDGDGHADLLAGAWLDDDGGLDAGSARLWSGVDGSEIFTLHGGPDDRLGNFVHAAGDMDGDGVLELAVASGNDDLVAPAAGSVQVVSFECIAASVYCTAKQNSQGCLPAISASGTLSATTPGSFPINASNVLNGTPGVLFYSRGGNAAIPLDSGTLCSKPPHRRTGGQLSGGNPPPDDCSGAFQFDFGAWIQAGSDPNLVPGVTVHAQYWSRDPGFAPPANSNLTDAVRFTLCP